MSRVIAIVMMATLTFTSFAQDKKVEDKRRAEAIKKQIADAEKTIKQLREELSKLDDDSFEEPKETNTLLFSGNIKVGLVGQLGGSEDRGQRIGNQRVANPIQYPAIPVVREVIDESTVVIAANRSASALKILLEGYSTKGLADGKFIEPAPTIRVTGTKKIGAVTYFTAKVYEPKK